MDPLSDVLRVVRLSGAFFYAVRAVEPWRVEAVPATELAPRILPETEHLISYHIVTSGRCWGGLRGGTLNELTAGDIVVFPHGDEHVMSSAPEGTEGTLTLESTPDRYPHTVALGPGGSPTNTLVCGFLGCDRRPFNPLLATLPPFVHVRGVSHGWIETFAAQVVEESRAKRAGAESVLTRLAELMFVEVLRRHLEQLPDDQSGWLAGLRDEYVGKALALLHADPRRSWTIEDLARETGLSRSAFAERFSLRVGQSPIQYLAQWRMQIASGLLTSGSAKVADVAEQVGYDSEAAFSRAFKKLVGASPTDWRRTRQSSAAPASVSAS
ncbi:MAG: AraC family transcriptional regulator [bacterium]